MLDPQKVTLSKLKEAFGLNSLEVESLLSELFPVGIFPYDTWCKAFEKWGMGRVETTSI